MNGTCASPTATGRLGSSEETSEDAAEDSPTPIIDQQESSAPAASGGSGGSGGSSLFRRPETSRPLGSRSQGIRKLQKCLSTSVSHYESSGGGDSANTTGATSGATNFPFHSQRSVDIRGYTANTFSSQASSSSLTTTSPYNLTNARQYSSFGSKQQPS